MSQRSRAELLEENRRLRAALDRERAAADPEAKNPYREAFRLGPAALAVSRMADGTFLDVNEQFLSVVGYERDELIGHSASTLGLWASEDERREVVQRARGEGEVYDVEFTLCTREGNERTMFGSCRHLAFGGEERLLLNCIDVTERQRMEAARRDSQELFQRVFESSPVALSLSNLSDQHFTAVNAAMCRLAGYEREEMVGRSARELGLWDDPVRRREMVAHLRAEGSLSDYEVCMRTRTGETHELVGSFQRMHIEGNDVLLSVLADISARKQVERSLREATQEAERAREEAEDLARFRSGVIANITHEVRTPLTVILGFTSILREGIDGPYRRFVDLIERSGRRLLLTLDSVLDLAQLESGTLEVNAHPHNLLDVIDSVASTARPFAEEKSLLFKTDLPDKALYAEFDSELLARALSHLVDNAVKFTDEGSVTLRARACPERVMVDVIDTGIGIKEEFVGDLFEVFSQESQGMDREYQGSGMGLAVAVQLVEQLDGEVEVETQRGAGSTFTIALPRAEQPSQVQWPEKRMHAT